MCGIGGFKRFGGEPITPAAVKIMACELASRGIDATGVAIQQQDGKVVVLKDDCPAWTFMVQNETKEFFAEYLTEDTQTLVLHTRGATQGDPKDNSNNHPLFDGVTAAVHNGIIHNDDQLFRELKLKRVGEVDSDIIRAILDEEGLTKKGLGALHKLRGSAAIAAVSAKYPGKLLLARSGSPIVLASTDGMLVWASTKGAIHAATRPFSKRFGMLWQKNRNDLSFMTMNDNSAYLIGPEGLEWHEDFKPCANYIVPNYAVHDNFQAHRRRWYAPAMPRDLVVCPNPKCRQLNNLSEELKKLSLNEVICGGCKQSLGAA